MAGELMNFSLSAFQDWQACEAKYNFRHVRKLQPMFKAPPLERGIILHDYLGSFYQALKDGRQKDEAHQIAMAKLGMHTARVDIAAAAAYYGGDEDLATELRAMPEELRDIAERYYRIHGRGDADRFEVMVVERRVQVLLVAGVQSTSVVDLVARDRETGIMYLWEHKTTGNIPSSAFRIRDLQTTLYSAVLERYQIHIEAILWNYVRTKVPAEPHQNKPTKANPIGALSKDRNIDTTWEKYAARIEELGLELEDYTDIYERLRDAETTKFFPRYENQIVVNTQELLLDYAVEGKRARNARYMWAQGAEQPVRTLGRGCDYCAYVKVCEAKLMGGDEEEVIKLRFVTEKERQQ